ncbi:hypothetical protein COY95_02015 [Candidatus Woesearchaeota archaeon CG_4_10_14_0_8_um_filter_47_5]|nr:MAG: hypothetical protein COY95_02015 [Candidatus Woesearchaeota archaeon CG_4_10_14_0_8_um_filter_47_5]
MLAVGNTRPEVQSAILTDADGGAIDLVPKGTVPVQCTGSVRDQDGYTDITKVSARIYHSGSSDGDTNGYTDHYTNASCRIYGGSAKTISYECTFNVYFHANPGTWYCNVTVTDTALSSSSLTASQILGVLMAIDVADGAINYGNLALGENTTLAGNGQQSKIVYNTGNIILDMNLDGFAASSGDAKAMSCTSGTIDAGYQRWSLSSGSYAKASSLTNGGVDIIPFNLAEQNDDAATAPTSKSLYFHMMVPQTPIVKGTCTGVMQFTAIPN